MDKQMTLSAFSDELANVRTTKKEFVVIPFSKPSESERQPKSAAASIGHRRFDG